MPAPTSNAILRIHCADRKGLVAVITSFILANNGNIVNLAEHVDCDCGMFVMRVEWDCADFAIPREKIAEQFQTLVASKQEQMHWSLEFSDRPLRMAIFVSKLSHCLFDILSRIESGEWDVEVPLIVSNHPDLGSIAERFGIPFHVLPISAETKAEQEARTLELLAENDVDFVVLARYMQILSPAFIERYPDRVINIHHSFLPAFPGGRPYHQAHERGVKIIGATSHYVTAELDGGPIIAQDVAAITHRDSV
ncbi:MAG: formyltetrahydrofolate deformylase, partial [Phycisphaerales bacterium]|nr:formyltetrahydrofolate deformylase [Phycisphaerales bacterium]